MNYNTPLPPPALVAPAIHSSEAASIWMAQVLAPIIQNIAGGVGAAVLAGLGGWAAEGQAVTAGVLKWALVIGLSVFGVSMIIRMFRDEVTLLTAAWSSRQDAATKQALRAEIDALEDALDALRTETALTANTARDAAEKMIMAYYANANPANNVLARQYNLEAGMSRAAWEAGSRLLKASGILTGGALTPSAEGEAVAVLSRHILKSRHHVATASGELVAM